MSAILSVLSMMAASVRTSCSRFMLLFYRACAVAGRMTQEDRHDQERAERPEETGNEVCQPSEEDAEAEGADEEAN